MTSYHAQLSKGMSRNVTGKNVTAIQKTGSFQNGQSMFQLSIKYSSGYGNEKNQQTNWLYDNIKQQPKIISR